jgi:hypothetical protein
MLELHLCWGCFSKWVASAFRKFFARSAFARVVLEAHLSNGTMFLFFSFPSFNTHLFEVFSMDHQEQGDIAGFERDQSLAIFFLLFLYSLFSVHDSHVERGLLSAFIEVFSFSYLKGGS